MDERAGTIRIGTLPPARPGPSGLRRRSIPVELATALRERILSGEIPGGSVLRQEALAAEYEVSRIPVREALRLLGGEGLVQLHPRRGAVVTAHSPEEIGEMFDLRAMLERDLVVRAVPRATPPDLERIEAILRQLDVAYRKDDSHAWGALNTEFHRALLVPAQRPQTLALVESISRLTERAIRLYHRLFTRFSEAQRDHREIVRLYRAGRADETGVRIERHVLDTKRTLVDALESRLAASAAGPRSRRRSQSR